MWKRFNTTGMIVGMLTGLISSIALIIISPSIMTIDAATATTKHLIQMDPIFKLSNPGIISIPLGFLGAVVGSLLSREQQAEELFSEMTVRANTGMAAEV
jgi:cation/acetate symporter